jgi:protein-tyrosine-phosphatase/tRNA A37 threonylcarbamoyladenosine synthetase subunit TsaC/SUA5/YrdC
MAGRPSLLEQTYLVKVAMAYSIDWKSADDRRDLVHLAVQSLAEGQLVILPTETSYILACSPLHPIAVEKLLRIYEQGFVGEPVLFLRSPGELRDYVPHPAVVAQRVAARLWPGPLILQLGLHHPDSLIGQFPASLRGFIESRDNEMGFRVASHPAIQEIQKLCAGPLLTGEILAAGRQFAFDSQIASSSVGRFAGLIVDDSVTSLGEPATLLATANNHCRIVREGAVTIPEVRSATAMIILLVCTGNTCRSPMAQVLLQHKLKKRFAKFFEADVPPAFALSAGTNAGAGSGASHEAVQAMKSRGLDLSQHASRQVNVELLQTADVVLTMTQNHRQAILSRWPHLTPKVFTLSSNGRDVADPYGGSQQVYLAAAAEIEHFLDEFVEQIDEHWLAQWD